jgi:hypothetical protein
MNEKTRLNHLIEMYHPDIDTSPNGYNHYGKGDLGHSLAEAIINPNSANVLGFVPSYSLDMTTEEAREESLSRIKKRNGW